MFLTILSYWVSALKFLLSRILLIAIFCMAILLFGCLSSLREYQVQQYHFYSPNVPPAFDQYRLSLISDIHIWDPHFLKSKKAIARQVDFDLLRLQEINELLQREGSSLLLLAGDYISYRRIVRAEFDLRPYLTLLPQPKDGIIAVLGNHDHFLLPRGNENPIIIALKEAKAQILVNQQIEISAPQDPNQVLTILGIDDFMFGKQEEQWHLFRNLKTSDFVLALSHNPDSFDLFERPELVDLALAGHLHGGQVTLFGLALTVPAQRKYLKQPFQTPHFPVLVSNGLGASRLQFRVMAPPQIWTIVLHRLDSNKNTRKRPNTANKLINSNQKVYWRMERKRLQSESKRGAVKVIQPQHPNQPYRLIRQNVPNKLKSSN